MVGSTGTGASDGQSPLSERPGDGQSPLSELPAGAGRSPLPGQPALDEPAAMSLALELARSGLGTCSPNPCVGAVVLDADGRLAGQGRTEPHTAERPGRHAEVVALAAAGERARGGTVLSTHEPCNGSGRTGPCAAALLAAGVARVVYAVADPSPGMRGGAATLAGAGVTVLAGLLAEEVARVHGPWLTAVTRSTPFVTLKLASGLDGRAAAADGSSRWITSSEARADAHQLRARVDAIVVGSGTVLADDPALTVRGTAEPRTPLRLVLDARGRTSSTARVYDRAAPTVRVTDHDLPLLLKTVYAVHGVRHLLVEGGPTVAGAFLAAGLVDEVVTWLAPAVLGAGTAAVTSAAFGSIGDAVRLQFTDVRRVGPDVRLTARPAPAQPPPAQPPPAQPQQNRSAAPTEA